MRKRMKRENKKGGKGEGGKEEVDKEEEIEGRQKGRGRRNTQ